MSEILVPDSDVAAGGWTTQAGGTTNLFQGIDETGTVNLTDYVQSALSPVADTYEFTLSNPSAILTSGVINLQIGKKNNNSVVVNLKFQLLQGTTLIREQLFSDIPFTPTLQQVTLTAPEIAAITDATLLRGKLIANPVSNVTVAFGSGATRFGANVSVNTFAGMTFPNPAAGRICVVAFSLFSAWAITSVTIGGVAATERVTTATSTNAEAHIFTAPVAAGTSLDVVITLDFHDSNDEFIVSSFSLTGLSSAVPADTKVFEFNNVNPIITTPTVPTGGAAIAVVTLGSGGVNFTWTAGTEAYDPVTQGTNCSGTSGSISVSGAQALSVSNTLGYFGVMAAAAWGP